MPKNGHDIVVVGASAGGVETLQQVLRGLPQDLAAAVFIVLHTGHQPWDLLPEILRRTTRLPVKSAAEGEVIQQGMIYVAIPDHHMVLSSGHIHVAHGPKENNVRPAIDPLFRSAALVYGPRVIGVVLSGTLDDGTAGLQAIKERGGITVAQDPSDALYPDMPESAIANARVDHIAKAAQMGELLAKLTKMPAPDEALFPVTSKLEIETKIAEGAPSSMETMKQLGTVTSLTCPECGGSLWELENGAVSRFRCHTGHAFSLETLKDMQSVEIERALWAAVRAMEENSHIAQQVAERARKHNNVKLAEEFEAKARESDEHLATLRAMLMKN